MSTLDSLDTPTLESLQIGLSPAKLTLSGTITTKDPGALLGGFFKSVHEAAGRDSLSELQIDVSKLTFVNSSAIRLFVDWATWVQQPSVNYKLRFLTNRTITWQKTSFMALKAIAKDALSVEHVS